MIMKELHVFCDESGNTGANLLDPAQPVYVLAGWGVRSDNKLLASAEVMHCCARYGIQGEMRAKKLLKTHKGRRAMVDLISKLTAVPCIPIFTIVEKRYAIAAKIVDAYLDHAFNPAAPQIPFSDALARSELANLFCDMPEDLLRRFAIAYRRLDIAELESVAIELSTVTGTNVSQDILLAVPKVAPRLSEIVLGETEFRRSQPNNVFGSLNFPIFMDMLFRVETLAEKTGHIAILHHDTLTEFEEGFKWIFNNYRSTGTTGEIVLTNGVTIPLSLHHISRLVMAESHDNPLIQAADVLAGFLSEISICAMSHTETDQLLKEKAKTIFPLVFFKHPLDFAGLLASNSFILNVATLLYPPTQ